ncbi:kidins220b [Symbiodinium sp. CCMP2456]|nr:kidins220b [Symbiodinium sp. CCMP2456]
MLRITLLSGEELTSIAVEDVRDVKALKQQLNKMYGLPPRFRQSLLHHGLTLDDSFNLDLPMDLQVVLTTFAEPSDSHMEQLIFAAKHGFVSEVEELLLLPMDPDAVPSFPAGDDRVQHMRTLRLFEPEFSESTALILAAGMNHPEVVQLLLEAGAKVNCANPCGWTALLSASKGSGAQVVQLLLEAGADVNHVICPFWGVEDNEFNGCTALMLAAESGRAQVVQLLLEARAHMNSANKLGSTALMEATRNGQALIVQMLLEAGARVNSADGHGSTALKKAKGTRRNQDQILQTLLEAGAQTDLHGGEGYTAPDLANNTWT